MNATTEVLKWTAPPLPEYAPLIAGPANEHGRGATQPNSEYQDSQYDFTVPAEKAPLAIIDGREVLPNQQVDVFPAPANPGYYGCSEAGWGVMAQLVGSEYLLPTVCDPHLWNSRGWRTLDTGEQVRVLGGGSFGKTPSAINGSGKLHGFKDWQAKVPAEWELAHWAQNRDLGILVRTNRARALDIDCNNPETVDAILEVVARHLGPDRWSHTPIRWRDNSARKTLLLIVEEPVSKQTAPIRSELRDPNAKKEEAYELLGDGQQTLWGGTHPSGARLQHSQLNAARGLPVVALVELELLWSELANKFAQDVVKAARLEKGHGAAMVLASNSDDPVAQYLFEQGHARGSDRGKVHVDCPWQEHHASSAGATPTGSASWLLAGVDADGKTMHGRFNCKHAGCKAHGSGRLANETNDRGLTERFLDAVGFRDAEIAASFPAMPAPAAMTLSMPPGALTVEPAPRRGLVAITREESYAKPPASFMLDNVLPYKGVVCLYGPSGAGKTFLVLDLIYHLMSGSTEWFGNKIYDRPKGILYIVLEDANGVTNRGKAWEQYHGVEPENIYFVENQTVNLSNTESVDDIITCALATMGKGCMVILDTQAQAVVGTDEQSAKDMGLVYSNLHKISRAIDGLCVTIAHSGKDDTKGVRGSSAQYAACDVVIGVKKYGGARVWAVEKSKLDVGGHPGHFTLERTVIGKHHRTGADLPSGYVLPRGAPSVGKELKGNDLLVFQAFETTAGLTEDDQVQEGAWRQNFKALYAEKKTDAKPKADLRAFSRGVDVLIDRGMVEKTPGGAYRRGTGVSPAFPALPIPGSND